MVNWKLLILPENKCLQRIQSSCISSELKKPATSGGIKIELHDFALVRQNGFGSDLFSKFAVGCVSTDLVSRFWSFLFLSKDFCKFLLFQLIENISKFLRAPYWWLFPHLWSFEWQELERRKELFPPPTLGKKIKKYIQKRPHSSHFFFPTYPDRPVTLHLQDNHEPIYTHQQKYFSFFLSLRSKEKSSVTGCIF